MVRFFNMSKFYILILVIFICVILVGAFGMFYRDNYGIGTRVGSSKIMRVFKDKKLRRLVLAATRGDTDTIDSLVKSGVDVNAVQKDGMTPLFWVVCQESVNLKGFESLLKHGANPNYIPPKNSDPLLYGLSVIYFLSAEPATHTNAVMALELALKYGGNPNIVNSHDHAGGQQTALMCAARWGRVANINVLLKFGAALEQKDETGMTALLWSAFNRHYNATYFLLNHGADYHVSAYFPGSEMDPRYKDKLKRIDLSYSLGVSLYTGINDDQVPWRSKVIAWLEAHGVPKPKPCSY